MIATWRTTYGLLDWSSSMESINEFLRHWQPTWTFLYYFALAAWIGGGTLANRVWSRRLDEARARKDGVDPDAAERG